MHTPTPPTPSPFGHSWSQEIAARCESRNLPPAVASIAAVFGALLDSNILDLTTAGAIARGEIDSVAVDGYLLALAADVAVRQGGAR